MKTIYTHLFFALGLISCLCAQSPQSFKYQTILRNLSGQPIANRPVRFQVGIQRGMNGPLVYQEQHSDTTNAQGMAILEVGRGTLINNSPAFSSIRWDSATHFLALSFDSTGTGNFLSMGSFELLSVPYALYAQSSGSSTPGPQGPQGIPGPQGPPGNGLSNGTATGQVLYWNGSAWVILNPGSNGSLFTLCDSIPTWTPGGQCPGTLTALSCSTSTHNGTLTSGVSASSVSSSIPYTGGNGGPHSGQTVTSTGITGLTAIVNAGSFVNGNGSLSYTITGTPAASGTASFAISIGGQSCTLMRTVDPPPIGSWRSGMVHCGSPTQVVDVVNPSTGRIWMDRNLGASRVATDRADPSAYGALFQWGRFADGHQCRNSTTIYGATMLINPGHTSFITVNIAPNDWLSPSNSNLWQGVNGTNNPCPIGYRVPTDAEWGTERASFSPFSAIGAFNSPLKLTVGGARDSGSGNIVYENTDGFYWSSTAPSQSSSYRFGIGNTAINGFSSNRSSGYSVRCIRD
jgi:uncharacterized protein (TIGR02145 family)